MWHYWNKFTFYYIFLCHFNQIFCLAYFSESMFFLLLIFLSIRTKDKPRTTTFSMWGPGRKGGFGIWEKPIQILITKFPDSGVLNDQDKTLWKDFWSCPLFWMGLEYTYSFDQRPNRAWLSNSQGEMSHYCKSQGFSLSN